MKMSIESLYSANLRPGPSPLLLPMRELRQSSGSSKPHINPSVLVIVIILSVVFLCSGILHILARCLGRRRAREVPGGLISGSSPGNSLRGQLQHLFSLHDSGVEQVFIDTLPVFLYGSIRGLKDSADCAVCLNEFANEDKLRLLPKCKHAFHTECIDTWLLSNSTCPLCRRSLLPEAEPVFTACAPPEDQIVTANATTTQPSHGSFRGSFRASLRGSFRFLTEAVAPPPPPPPPPPPEPANTASTPTPPMTPGPTVSVPQPDGSEKTLRVELGRVNIERIATGDVGSSRMARSYSMGSYEYIVDFSSLGLAMQGEPSSSKPPTHRSSLSDGIPELSSASHTPGQEDMFWASRGLDTPSSLSRVREIMTPSPGWNSSPLFLASQKQKQQQRVKMEQEDDDGGEIKPSTSLNSSPNPNSNASVGMVESTSVPVVIQTAEEAEEAEEAEGEASPVQRPLSRSLSLALLRSPTQELGAAARKDKVWEVSVDVSEPPQEKSPSSMKSSPLNWLRGRGRRLVYSAASPSATDRQQQSPEVKNTT